MTGGVPRCADCHVRLEATLADGGRWLSCPRCGYRIEHRTIPEWIAEARRQLDKAAS